MRRAMRAKVNLRSPTDVYTHIVVDKKFEFIFGVVQSQQSLEEFRKEWGWLLDEHSDLHIRILLFIVEERQISMF